MEFKPMIPAFVRAKTFHAFDRAATVTGPGQDNVKYYSSSLRHLSFSVDSLSKFYFYIDLSWQ
jgi:hypothetical protein